ncbi:c-type cytochrome biogenesis protein CcsB [Corynebacterium falsenii]|uniref:c-type cytochrome biogenesis protein CcsB n=1 Tax=Corynebacterium falsenii TaxID=108486 RepID=UPI001D5012F7|nr:c-type cytochrome biogenesis protein CcsB [Corynebacterium falsenii]HJF11640.1 c-type cytochrome biogenesis protein CcsB [Corynebacterium falsenii]
MIIDQELSQFADLAYRTAEAVYLLALAVSLVFYGIIRVATDRRRERAEELSKLKADSREKVLAATGASTTGATGGGIAVDDEAGTTATSYDDQLPERLRVDNVRKQVERADKLGGITQALVWLGIALHVVFVVLRGMAAGRFPWGNLFEYVSVVTMFAMIIAALVIRRKSMRVMWPWILTPVVLLLFYGGTKLYAQTAPVVPALKSYWFVIHVSTVSIGGGIGLVSGMASIMYLFRRVQPKGKEKGIIGAIVGPLPDAAKLDALAYRTAIWTLPIFGLGIIFGAIWADAAWGRFWGWDPKETVSFVTWLLYAGYLHARATPGWRGPKSAWINVLAFATMVFNLFFINMVVSGLHSYAGLS